METNIGENSNPENSFTESPGGIKKHHIHQQNFEMLPSSDAKKPFS